MAAIAPGARVKIRSEVASGAFPDERLVTFSTEDGPVSGFVRSDDIRESFVIADVKEIAGDTIVAWVQGSFFTTTGLVRLSKFDIEPANPNDFVSNGYPRGG